MATITAIFEHGVFRPLEPVELPEHTRVEFEPKVSEASVLPFALQDTDITDRDVETLLRVARDKEAPAGRYKRTPKKVAPSRQK